MSTIEWLRTIAVIAACVWMVKRTSNVEQQVRELYILKKQAEQKHDQQMEAMQQTLSDFLASPVVATPTAVHHADAQLVHPDASVPESGSGSKEE